MAQRVMLAQQELQMAQAAPQIHDLREAYKRMYEALEVKNIDALLPVANQVPPRDPITEQQSAMLGQPIKAFEFQSHEAYIAAHAAFMQNPMIQQIPVALQSIQANIQEHQAMLYKQQIEEALGQPLPELQEGQEMPPEVMNQIAAAAAKATQEVTGQAQAMAEAQQKAEELDPLLQVKREEIEASKQRDALRTQVDLAKIESQESIAEMKVAQDREEALLKAQDNVNKNYGQILKDVRSADTNTRGD